MHYNTRSFRRSFIIQKKEQFKEPFCLDPLRNTHNVLIYTKASLTKNIHERIATSSSPVRYIIVMSNIAVFFLIVGPHYDHRMRKKLGKVFYFFKYSYV